MTSTLPSATPAWPMQRDLVRGLLARKDWAQARLQLEAALGAAPGAGQALLEPALWLAMVCRAQRDGEAELAALDHALSIDPYDLMALLFKGDCLTRLGRSAAALAAHRAACAVASEREDGALESLGAELQGLLRQSRLAVQQGHRALGQAVDRLVVERGAHLQGAARDRFVHAIDLMLGRRQRFDPAPMGFYYPQLAPQEFFRRERFPWLPAFEAHTPHIKQELQALLARGSGLEPYMQLRPDQPKQQWAGLNGNPQWSALHLIKGGEVQAHAAQCPITMQALASVPQPRQLRRTPVALFSCLQAQTHIPPHVGVSNVRVLAHLPLEVPPDCALRVGSSVHVWEEGKICVFDDTIEHEAWNKSNRLRVVLIFDLWHPDLSLEEQDMLEALAQVQSDLMTP